ncbi:PilW family protein [Luteibacter sp. NPDC031894]|uniref:PilW family protein n=1 Tax=Luteibacter sp. NPDC031894 TaxID=3390572 RepID=UPI003CFDE71F
MHTSGRRQRGFSLVELMVSLVIGLIVVAGLISVLMANRQAFTLQQSNNFNQENVRFAASRLAWSLRMADFWGGVKPASIVPTANKAGIGGDGCDADWVLSVGTGKQNGVFGYDGGDTFPIPKCVDDANYVKGSDVLVVRYADTTGYDPDKGADTPAFDSTDLNLVPNQTSILLVSGLGQQAALFRRGDPVPKSTLPIATGRYVYPYQLEMYYLRPCADPGANDVCDASDDGGTPSPSLVRMRLDATGKPVSEVVVDGIEQLSFEYSWLAGPDPANLHQVPFAKASDTSWPTVTQVRATFIARSATRDTRVPHGGTFLLSPHCAYAIANDGAVTYPATDDTNLCKDQPDGTYGDNPQQYARTISSQVVLLRNRVRG